MSGHPPPGFGRAGHDGCPVDADRDQGSADAPPATGGHRPDAGKEIGARGAGRAVRSVRPGSATGPHAATPGAVAAGSAVAQSVRPPPTAGQALAAAVARLRAAGVPDPATDARRLLAHALRLPAVRLTLALPEPLPEPARLAYDAALAARCARRPVAQITGQRAFWGRGFRVTGDVLDPRPETETLIAVALERPADRLLDLGTGSGCLLLTLLAEWPRATGIGTDLSDAALAVAAANAADLGLTARAELIRADWTEGLGQGFDLIVSNPPYIAAADLPDLAPEVRDWEPALALSPGGDGLDAYRALIPGAARRLRPGGRLLLEIGPTQAAAVGALGQAAGLAHSATHPDFDGRDRVVALTALGPD